LKIRAQSVWEEDKDEGLKPLGKPLIPVAIFSRKERREKTIAVRRT
jgi:hypothetical protein